MKTNYFGLKTSITDTVLMSYGNSFHNMNADITKDFPNINSRLNCINIILVTQIIISVFISITENVSQRHVNHIYIDIYTYICLYKFV